MDRPTQVRSMKNVFELAGVFPDGRTRQSMVGMNGTESATRAFSATFQTPESEGALLGNAEGAQRFSGLVDDIVAMAVH